MDVRQLLLLAGDNSALAKKKIDRLGAKSVDDEPKISRDSVAAYLAKQKAFKQKIQAEEEESRKKRVQARLDASLGKPTRRQKKEVEKEKATSGHFLPGDKRSLDVVKEQKKTKDKVEKKEKVYRQENIKTEKTKPQSSHKKRSESPENKKTEKTKPRSSHKKRSESPECPAPKKKNKADKEKPSSKTESSKQKGKEKDDNENTHRKYRRRTVDTFETSVHEEKLKEKEKNARIAKEKGNKSNKNVNKGAPSGMSFTDLLKLAKTNASSTRLAEDGTLIKKQEKAKTFDEEYGRKKSSKSRDQADESSHEKKSKYREEDEEIIYKSKHSHSSSNSSRDTHRKSKSKHEYDEPSSKSKHSNGDNSGKSKHLNVNDSDHKDKKKLHNGKSEFRDHSKKSVSENVSNGRARENEICSSKQKHDSHSKNSKNNESVKYSEDSPPPVKRGLIAQTISTKKNGKIETSGKISNVYKQVKPGKVSGIEAQIKSSRPNGIEAQFKKSKPKLKRPVRRDVNEDDFEKEARMLARKRKLFEMQRITGNSTLDEEDVESDYDYDLSEEEEDDGGFIDDSEPVASVSKYIRKITGYDRRMYDDSDDDDHNMESSYTQIQKEEARSSRIAKEEDRIAALEEEAEEARQQAKMKKKR